MKNIFFTGAFLPAGKPGICSYKLDTGSGALEKIAECTSVENPSYLCVNKNGDRLYAVSELEGDGGCVVSFEIRPDGGLTEINRAPVTGAGATHIAVNGKNLAAAQYWSGDVDIYELDSRGGIGRRIFNDRHTGSGPVEGRQDCAHAHYAGFDPFDENSLWSVDLGNDTIYVYRIDDGGVRPERTIPIPQGDGPRHLLFSQKHPDLVYCVCEITFRVHTVEKSSGRIISTVSAIDEGFDGFGGAAAIRFDKGEKHICVSNRVLDPPSGMDSLALSGLDENGVPGKPTITKTVLRFPRDMNIFTACGLTAVAYQLDDTLQIRRGNDVLCEVRSDAVCCVSDLI